MCIEEENRGGFSWDFIRMQFEGLQFISKCIIPLGDSIAFEGLHFYSIRGTSFYSGGSVSVGLKV